MREVGRFCGKPVQMRSLDDPVSVSSDAVIAQLVRHDPQDVGPMRIVGVDLDGDSIQLSITYWFGRRCTMA